MVHKNRVFLVTFIASTLLVACGTDTNNTLSDQPDESIESSSVETEVTTTKSSVEAEATTIPNASLDVSAAETKTETEEQAPEVVSEEDSTDAEIEEEPSVEHEPAELDEMDEDQELALNALIAGTHLEKDGYSFFFPSVDSLDFIPIEVREIKDSAASHLPLEGVYRYVIETEEILVRDYLTGDFIPYETIE